MKTISFDEAIYKLVPVDPCACMKMGFAYHDAAGKPFSHQGYESMLAAVPDTLPGVVAHSGEPVEYQTRMHPAWIRNGEGYTAWAPCSAGSYADTEKLGTYNDWEYEVRKLYLHPPAQPDTAALQARIAELELQDESYQVKYEASQMRLGAMTALYQQAKRPLREWHETALKTGFDGVASALEQLAAQAGQEPVAVVFPEMFGATRLLWASNEAAINARAGDKLYAAPANSLAIDEIKE